MQNSVGWSGQSKGLLADAHRPLPFDPKHIESRTCEKLKPRRGVRVPGQKESSSCSRGFFRVAGQSNLKTEIDKFT